MRRGADRDDDGNGVDDYLERDSDGDGLLDKIETEELNSDPQKADSDENGISDLVEYKVFGKVCQCILVVNDLII